MGTVLENIAASYDHEAGWHDSIAPKPFMDIELLIVKLLELYEL